MAARIILEWKHFLEEIVNKNDTWHQKAFEL